MPFRVYGADRNTGRDVARVYAANTEAAARELARADGLIVAEVEFVGTGPAAAVAAAPTADAPPLSYRSPTTPAGPAPTYAGLSVAGGVLRVYTILCYVLGGLSFAAAAFAVAMSLANGGGGVGPSLPVGILTIASMLTPGVALLFAAAVSHGLSAACVALRDIARNSWR